MRVFDLNIKSLPGARLYFFRAGSTTPKVTYADKQGTIPNANPVIASPAGIFPPVFLDGLYRVELRSSANIVQPGWPIDNVGQDSQIVPYAPWSEIVTYAEFERVTDTITGIVYRSKENNNLGNVPASSPSKWEVVIDPIPSSFTSNAGWLSWSDEGGQISLDVDFPALIEAVEVDISGADGNFLVGGDLAVSGTATVQTPAQSSDDNSVINSEWIKDYWPKESAFTEITLVTGMTGSASYIKYGNICMVNISISNNDVLNNPLLQLPVGARPSSVLRGSCVFVDNTNVAFAKTLTLNSSGSVNFSPNPVTANGTFTGMIIFPVV